MPKEPEFTERLNLRLSAAHRAALEEIERRSGQNFSDWIRKRIEQAAKRGGFWR